jgi:glycine reductase
MPVFLDPNELEDGAIVSGQFGHPALRNPTYLYQNHPVVNALRTRDGRDLEFGGLIVCPEPEDVARKELISAVAARLCASLGFDAVIVTKEGGGNADADVAFKMDELERLGIESVGILAEMSGQDGTGPPIVLQPTLATALVSTGNYDEKVLLDSVEVALGGDWVNFADAPASGELEIPIAAIVAALSPLGWGHLRAVEATR